MTEMYACISILTAGESLLNIELNNFNYTECETHKPINHTS